MELRSLRYFVAIVDAGSLTRAAGALYVAQPALTAQVKQLESEFGVQLLERSHAGVVPTAAGLQLYQEAIRLLADAEALRLRIGKPAGEPEGSVTIAFPGLLVPSLAGRLLMRVADRYPRIRVYLIDGISLVTQRAVQDGRADFGLLIDPPALAGLSVDPLAQEAIYLVGLDRDGSARAMLRISAAASAKADRPPAPAGPQTMPAVALPDPMPAEPSIRFADAAGLPLVMQSRRFAIPRQAQEAASRLGLRLNVVHEHDSAAVIRALENEGAAFSFAPASVAVSVRSGAPDRICARIIEPEFLRTYAISRLSGRQLSAAALAVMDLLRAEVAEAIGEKRWTARLLESHQIN